MHYALYIMFLLSQVNCQLTHLEVNAPLGTRNAAMWCTHDRQYIFGGKSIAGRTHDMWMYSGKWTQLPPGPDALSGVIHWTHDNDMWMYGGRTTTSITDTLYKYTDRWTLVSTNSAGPGPRYGSTFWHTGTMLYLYGGRSDNHTVEQDMWTLDMNTLAWTRVSTDAGPGPLDDGKAAIDQKTGTVYVYGGENQQDSIQENVVWIYQNNAWTTIPTGIKGREDHVMWFTDDSLYIASGKDEFGNVDDAWRYTPGSAPEWTRLDLRLNRWGAATCQTSDDSTYIYGGRQTDEMLLNDMWKYGPVQSRDSPVQIADVMSTLTFVLVLVVVIAFALNKYKTIKV